MWPPNNPKNYLQKFVPAFRIFFYQEKENRTKKTTKEERDYQGYIYNNKTQD